jgi:hypothetical protein
MTAIPSVAGQVGVLAVARLLTAWTDDDEIRERRQSTDDVVELLYGGRVSADSARIQADASIPLLTLTDGSLVLDFSKPAEH